jgi:hypothetical protein
MSSFLLVCISSLPERSTNFEALDQAADASTHSTLNQSMSLNKLEVEKRSRLRYAEIPKF